MACEFQLFLVLPPLVFILTKVSTKAKVAIIASIVMLSMGLMFTVIWTNNLAAGLFAP